MVRFIRGLLPYTTGALVAALAYMGWTLYERRASDRRFRDTMEEKEAAKYRGFEGAGSGLRLLQFYASPAVLTEGEKALLCYGVANAETVQIEPGVEAVTPALNRCLQVAPEETTRYTITASGGGKKVTESLVLQVQADPDRQPKVLSFSISRRQPDGTTTLCFETRNAAVVSIEPRVLPPGPLLRGCFAVAPAATTTYKLTAADTKGRKASRELTVSVP